MKNNLSKSRIKEEKSVRYHVRQAFFNKSTKDWKLSNVLPSWLVDPDPPGVVSWKTLNLYRKFHFIGNFKVTQWFVTIVGCICKGWNFISKFMVWLEILYFFCPKDWQRSLFSQTVAEFPALTQWTPWFMNLLTRSSIRHEYP